MTEDKAVTDTPITDCEIERLTEALNDALLDAYDAQRALEASAKNGAGYVKWLEEKLRKYEPELFEHIGEKQ